MNKKILVTLSILFLSGYVIAEEFVKNNPVRRKSNSQIKQDIIQKLANLVKIESKTIEVNAQVQASLFNQIESLTENNKQSWFNQNKSEKLQEYSDRLSLECKESELRLKSLQEFNSHILKTFK